MTTFSWGSRPEDARRSVLGVGDVTAFPHLQVVATGHRRHLSCQEQRPFRLGRLWNGQSQDKDQYMYQQYRVQQYKTTFFFLCVCVCQGLAPRMSCVLDSHPRNARSLFPKQSAKGLGEGRTKRACFPPNPSPCSPCLIRCRRLSRLAGKTTWWPSSPDKQRRAPKREEEGEEEGKSEKQERHSSLFRCLSQLPASLRKSASRKPGQSHRIPPPPPSSPWHNSSTLLTTYLLE